MTEFSFPQLIVVPLSCHEVDGVRKEKERLTAAQRPLHELVHPSLSAVMSDSILKRQPRERPREDMKSYEKGIFG